jgi:CRISPR/Cas system endoribonuclease Cas6 (RAMP superfamily)
MLDGPPLPFVGEQAAQAARCLVSEYRLETGESVLAGRSHLGFLGWIEYICRASEADAVASLNALARLVFFTGCGYLTEYGMGTTTVTIAK